VNEPAKTPGVLRSPEVRPSLAALTGPVLIVDAVRSVVGRVAANRHPADRELEGAAHGFGSEGWAAISFSWTLWIGCADLKSMGFEVSFRR